MINSRILWFSLLIAFLNLVLLTAQIYPVQNGSKFSLSVGDVFFEVDSAYGARISSFKHGTKELLKPGKGMTGSTLWTSPQSEWGWPTLPTTDTDPYSVSIEGGKMTFKSDEERGISGKRFKFEKSFWANESNNSISIRYLLINTGSSALTNSLWSVTRVNPEGLTFWKESNVNPWGGSIKNKIVTQNNYSWIDFKQSNGTCMKFFSDIGAAGWFAHLTDDGYLFIKTMEDVTPDDFATGEAEFEYWVDCDVNYIELENQSKFTTVPAGDTLIYDVVWHLEKLPAEISSSLGSTELIAHAEDIAASDLVLNTSNTKNPLKVMVFPNPVNDKLTILLNNIGKTTLSLFDLSGRIILYKNFTQTLHLDVSHLSRGAYIYKLENRQQHFTGKIIKQ